MTHGGSHTGCPSRIQRDGRGIEMPQEAGSFLDRQPQGLSLSLHCSGAVFANNAGYEHEP